MPFLSQDWRGPGEDWVRGQDGWEIMRRGEARDKVMEEKDMVKEDVEEGEEEGDGTLIYLEIKVLSGVGPCPEGDGTLIY